MLFQITLPRSTFLIIATAPDILLKSNSIFISLCLRETQKGMQSFAVAQSTLIKGQQLNISFILEASDHLHR